MPLSVDRRAVKRDAAIEQAFFRQTEDGGIVFFPWGLSHRGYRLPDAEARVRARRAISALLGGVIGIGAWMAHALQTVLEAQGAGAIESLEALAAPLVALGGVVGAYALWLSRFVERCQASDLEVSREERLREAARLSRPWQVAAAGLVMAGLSGLVIWLEPRIWWLGALGVGVGVGLAAWSRVLESHREPGPDG